MNSENNIILYFYEEFNRFVFIDFPHNSNYQPRRIMKHNNAVICISIIHKLDSNGKYKREQSTRQQNSSLHQIKSIADYKSTLAQLMRFVSKMVLKTEGIEENTVVKTLYMVKS